MGKHRSDEENRKRYTDLVYRIADRDGKIPAARLGIKAWGIIDWARKTGQNPVIDYTAEA